MNSDSTEADFYCEFLKQEIPVLEDMLYNTPIESEAAYEYAVLKLNMHFASRVDTDEIRDLLAQDPLVTGAAHSLASLFFANAANELQMRLIENLPEAKGTLIGHIIGVEVPQNPAAGNDLPPRPATKSLLALYKALPKGKRATFDAVVASKMTPSP